MLGGNVRAIRGATTIPADEPHHVHAATSELLRAMIGRNGIQDAELISAVFTVTADITSAAPAAAARALGWHDVPLLCVQEMPTRDALPRCIRVMLHVATRRSRASVAHVYLREAGALRPDLAGAELPAEARIVAARRRASLQARDAARRQR